MGQSQSGLGHRHGRRRSINSSFFRRSKLNSSNLSHTFSLPCAESFVELVNINTASEEQLMTLPGVTRQIAAAIVDHRQAIGRFKRVDDLALVSGIGADKLDAMRSEICTGRKILPSSSSRTQSLDSLRSGVESKSQLNINTATIFQLQCIPGLNQELAANIIDHRTKKGPYKSIDDLIKVRGMDQIRLGTVKCNLSLESCHSTDSNHGNCMAPSNGIVQYGISATKVNHSQSIKDVAVPNSILRTPGHRKSMSVPIKYCMTLSNGFAAAPVNDIFDLLSAYSHRPIIEEDFNYERDGKPCFRIATWNIHRLGVEKASNPGVREVFCRTVLENRISILCLQEVLEEAALQIICEELNSPTLRRVREWKGNSMHWKYIITKETGGKQLAFLYNKSCSVISIEEHGIQRLCEGQTDDSLLSRMTLLQQLEALSNKSNNFEASVAYFSVHNKDLLVLNVCIRSELSEEDYRAITNVVNLAEKNDVPITVLGDFLSLEHIRALSPSCTSILKEESNTVVESSSGVCGRSDILTSRLSSYNFKQSGIVRSGLSHLAIPRAWSWGGPASPHCPVWAEYQLQ